MIKWTVNADDIIDVIKTRQTKLMNNFDHAQENGDYDKAREFCIKFNMYSEFFRLVTELEELEFVDEAKQ